MISTSDAGVGKNFWLQDITICKIENDFKISESNPSMPHNLGRTKMHNIRIALARRGWREKTVFVLYVNGLYGAVMDDLWW